MSEKLYTQKEYNDNSLDKFEAGRRAGNKQRHNLYASEETLEKFCEVNTKIDIISGQTRDIHSAIFGVDNVGGLVKTVERIEAQTIKTNGSVRGLQIWKSFIVGGMAVITMVVIPMITFIFFDKINQLNDKIEDAKTTSVAEPVNKLSDLISKYNIGIK